MEMGRYSTDLASLEKTMVCSVLKAVAVEALLSVQNSLAFLLTMAFQTESLFHNAIALPKLTDNKGRFPLEELNKRQQQQPDLENKDTDDSEDDDEDGDDASDEDFSGEEEGGEDEGGEDEGKEEEKGKTPEANGNGVSDDDEDEDDEDDEEGEDGEDDEDDEDGDEEDDDEEDEEDEDDEDEDQPPAKKRK